VRQEELALRHDEAGDRAAVAARKAPALGLGEHALQGVERAALAHASSTARCSGMPGRRAICATTFMRRCITASSAILAERKAMSISSRPMARSSSSYDGTE
jgi:hypothetical protein